MREGFHAAEVERLEEEKIEAAVHKMYVVAGMWLSKNSF